MMINNTSYLLLLGLLLVASVNSVVPQAAANLVCPSPGRFQLTVEPAGGNAIQYDQVSNYFVDYDSVELFLKNSDVTHDFKFTSFQDDYSTPVQKVCEQTAGFTFIGLVDRILVVQDPESSNYYACKFDPTAAADIPRAQLLLPVGVTVIQFIPYYWNELYSQLWVAINEDSKGATYMYNINVDVTTGTTTLAVLTKGAPFYAPLVQFSGTGAFFYNKDQRKIYEYKNDATYEDSIASVPFTASDVIDFVPLSNDYIGLTVLTSDRLSGTIYLLQAGNIVSVAITHTSTTPYESRTDSLSNYVVIGQGYFFWLNIDAWARVRSSQIIDGIDTSQMVDMSLSGNKAIIFYEDRVDYYQISGLYDWKDAPVELITSKAFTTSWSTDGQYRFEVSCMCGGLKRFACYSSTLNCLIIKMAAISCGTKDIPIYLGD